MQHSTTSPVLFQNNNRIMIYYSDWVMEEDDSCYDWVIQKTIDYDWVDKEDDWLGLGDKERRLTVIGCDTEDD
jgi:hypothetical protein